MEGKPWQVLRCWGGSLGESPQPWDLRKEEGCFVMLLSLFCEFGEGLGLPAEFYHKNNEHLRSRGLKDLVQMSGNF